MIIKLSIENIIEFYLFRVNLSLFDSFIIIKICCVKVKQCFLNFYGASINNFGKASLFLQYL